MHSFSRTSLTFPALSSPLALTHSPVTHLRLCAPSSNMHSLPHALSRFPPTHTASLTHSFTSSLPRTAHNPSHAFPTPSHMHIPSSRTHVPPPFTSTTFSSRHAPQELPPPPPLLDPTLLEAFLYFLLLFTLLLSLPPLSLPPCLLHALCTNLHSSSPHSHQLSPLHCRQAQSGRR